MDAAVKKQPQDIPHHVGHRDRLRKRFLKTGAEGLADYEVLELLLFSAVPRRDVKPLAKDLIKKFGSLSAVVAADPDDLKSVVGISETTAVALKVVQAAAQQMLREQVMNKPILSTWDSLLDYCHVKMAHETTEQFRVFYLNKKNVLIADELQQTGTIDHAPVYPREVIKRALELGATALILVHNHPSGDATPSQDDIDMTKKLAQAAVGVGVVIHDHIIVSKSGSTSFKTLGLL